MKVQRLERGWGGHFICAHQCMFRRNTLLTCGDQRIVVSTVGALRDSKENLDQIGHERYYETMAFIAALENGYWDADVSKQIKFDSEWAITAKTTDELPPLVDTVANDMHEAVVNEITKAMKNNTVEVME